MSQAANDGDQSTNCEELNNDGMLFLMRAASSHHRLLDLRFPYDVRAVKTVRDMLQSSEPSLMQPLSSAVRS